jgi:hypothetical protein
MTSDDIEAWFVSVARSSRLSAKRVAGMGVAKDEGEIARHREVALKAMRAATDLCLRRENEHLVRTREKRIMDRSRGHH